MLQETLCALQNMIIFHKVFNSPFGHLHRKRIIHQCAYEHITIVNQIHLISTNILKKAFLEESSTPINDHEASSIFVSPSQTFSSSSMTERPKTSNNRYRKSALSRPLPISNSDSDNTIIYRLIIQDGKIRDQTEEFLRFRQSYSDIWSSIMKIVLLLEKLMHNYYVSIALIDGEK